MITNILRDNNLKNTSIVLYMFKVDFKLFIVGYITVPYVINVYRT